MTSLNITPSLIPNLTGKTAIVTGGSSGIGFGAVQVLLEHHARVFILDIAPPPSTLQAHNVTYIHTDISSWSSLVKAMRTITTEHNSTVDIAIANAGVFETDSYANACIAPLGTWQEIENSEPVYNCVEVNLKGTLNFIMLAARVMKEQESGGSIVLTTSMTAYLPEQSVPVYSAIKAALANLVRALAPTFPLHNLAISAVAPSAASSAMVTPALTDVLEGLNIPVSTAQHVGLALVYSATAMQKGRVEDYGKDKPIGEGYQARWNGRIIHTIGDEFWEVEEELVKTRRLWWGAVNEERAGRQRVVTDARDI